MNKKQRFLCKNCGCNYTGGINGYPESVKKEAIRYYLEGIGFRKIERLLKTSHVSVINWVKKEGKKLKKIKPKEEKVSVLELDELCVNYKKNIWLWTAVTRETQRLVGFQVGTRETKYFEKLSQKISHVEVEKYASGLGIVQLD